MPPAPPVFDPPVIRPNLRRSPSSLFTSPTGGTSPTEVGGAAREGGGIGAGGAGGRIDGPSSVL